MSRQPEPKMAGGNSSYACPGPRSNRSPAPAGSRSCRSYRAPTCRPVAATRAGHNPWESLRRRGKAGGVGAHDAGVVARLAQRLGDGDVGLQQRGVGAVVAADRSVPQVLARHQHRAGRRADLARVAPGELEAGLGHARDVGRRDAVRGLVDLHRDGVVAVLPARRRAG